MCRLQHHGKAATNRQYVFLAHCFNTRKRFVHVDIFNDPADVIFEQASRDTTARSVSF
jgi:hypothetical protein